MRESSRAYIMSHIKLREEIYNNWIEFNNHLHAGPNHMKQYLLNLWNSINPGEYLEINLIDKDRKVSIEDFDISMNSYENINVFYFILPNPDSFQVQAKCVALALTPKFPRYFTMEISKNIISNEANYTMGEWVIENNKFVHLNYGEIPNGTIANFSKHVLEKLKDTYI